MAEWTTRVTLEDLTWGDLVKLADSWGFEEEERVVLFCEDPIHGPDKPTSIGYEGF